MNWFKSLVGLSAALLLWQLVSWLNLVNPIYFASPLEVALAFFELFKTGVIFLDLFETVFRVLVSIGVSALIGIPIGVLLGFAVDAFEYLEKMLDFFRSIPYIVFYPLFLIILGPSDSSRISTAILGCTIMLIFIIATEFNHQNHFRRRYFQCSGANSWQVIRHVVFFEALPHILLGLKTIASLAMIIIIVTEMLVGSRFGLGSRITDLQISNEIPALYATIILIGLVGLLLNKAVALIEKQVVFWKIG